VGKAKPSLVLSVPFTESDVLPRALGEGEADYVELRLDYFRGMLDQALLDLLRDYREKLILTVRDPAEGGFRRVEDRSKKDFLVKAMDMGFKCDVEARFARKYGFAVDGQIVSFHSAPSLPSLAEIDEAFRGLDAGVVKVVVPAMGPYRSLLTEVLERYPGSAVMSYGGDPLERLGFSLLGSSLLYAGSVAFGRTASGQPELRWARRVLDEFFGRAVDNS